MEKPKDDLKAFFEKNLPVFEGVPKSGPRVRLGNLLINWCYEHSAMPQNRLFMQGMRALITLIADIQNVNIAGPYGMSNIVYYKLDSSPVIPQDTFVEKEDLLQRRCLFTKSKGRRSPDPITP